MLADPQQTKTDNPGEPGNILMSLSPQTKLSDIEALLNNYAVELIRDATVQQRGPLWHCASKGGIRYGQDVDNVLDAFSEAAALDFDPTLSVRMLRLGSCPPEKARWPFFVESELQVMFSIGYQWWKFVFSPGKTYTERDFSAHPEAVNPSTQDQPK